MDDPVAVAYLSIGSGSASVRGFVSRGNTERELTRAPIHGTAGVIQWYLRQENVSGVADLDRPGAGAGIYQADEERVGADYGSH